jgi:hypothetical protein
VRRDELARLGIQLPVLPTLVLGGLPGQPGWALRLERAGLDVVASGAAADTPATWWAAVDEVPHRPVKGKAGDVAALAAAGCRLVETNDRVPAGVYGLNRADGVVRAVTAADGGASPDEIAARILSACREVQPASLWVAAGPGLDGLRDGEVEVVLQLLVDGARTARLALAKRQFEL